MSITEDFYEMAVEMLDEFIVEPNAAWVQSADHGPIDPDKPWDVEHGETIEHDVKILFYPRDIRNNEFLMYLRQTEIPTGVIFGIMRRYDSFEPDLNDVVRWNGKTLQLTFIDPVQPINDAIVYLLELRN